MTQPELVAKRRKLPLPVAMLAVVSLLNEVSAQMVAPLIPILLVSVLAAGPVAIGAVEGIADAVAAFLRLWSGRHADVRPQRRKAMVFFGYGLALVSRRATPKDMQGRAYGLNRGMDYAGAVLGSLIAAGLLAWWGMSISQVILLSALPGLAVLVLLALLPNPATAEQIDRARHAERAPLRWSALSPSLRAYLKVLALFCFAKASEAFIILRGHELGMSTVTLLLLWAWLATLQSVVALAGAPATDRISKRSLTLLNWTFLAIGYAALAWVSTSAGLWVAVSIYGILSGISEGVERSLVSELADASGKGTAFGWYHMISGLAAIPAGLLFGWVWKIVGPAGAFAMTAVIALACALWLKLSLGRSAVASGARG